MKEEYLRYDLVLGVKILIGKIGDYKFLEPQLAKFILDDQYQEVERQLEIFEGRSRYGKGIIRIGPILFGESNSQ